MSHCVICPSEYPDHLIRRLAHAQPSAVRASSGASRSALCHSHGARLCRLGEALHPFSRNAHPDELGAAEIGAFLNWLANERDVAASTQNQALNALLFLYTQVLNRPPERLAGLVRARRPEHLPTVFTEREVAAVLASLEGQHWLMAALLYGSGLRLMECVRMRVKDIDFGYRCIVVRDGKGHKDRVVTLADGLIEHLRQQIERVRLQHQRDLTAGYGSVYLPEALARKYPNASRELGHRDVRTTQIYTHLLERGGNAVVSPLSRLLPALPVER